MAWEPPATDEVVDIKETWTPPATDKVVSDTARPTVTLDPQTLEATKPPRNLDAVTTATAKAFQSNESLKQPRNQQVYFNTLKTKGYNEDDISRIKDGMGQIQNTPPIALTEDKPYSVTVADSPMNMSKAIVTDVGGKKNYDVMQGTMQLFASDPKYKESSVRDAYYAELQQKGLPINPVFKNNVENSVTKQKLEEGKGWYMFLNPAGEPAKVIPEMAKAGIETDKASQKAFDEGRYGSGIILGIKAVVDMAMAGLSATPAGLKFVQVINASSSVAPHITEKALAPVSWAAEEIFDYKPQTETEIAAFSLLDFAAFGVGLAVGHVGGKAGTKYVKDLIDPSDSQNTAMKIKELTEKFGQLTPEQKANAANLWSDMQLAKLNKEVEGLPHGEKTKYRTEMERLQKANKYRTQNSEAVTPETPQGTFITPVVEDVTKVIEKVGQNHEVQKVEYEKTKQDFTSTNIQPGATPNHFENLVNYIQNFDTNTPINEVASGISVQYKGRNGQLGKSETGEVTFTDYSNGKSEIITGGGDVTPFADHGLKVNEGYTEVNGKQYAVQGDNKGYTVYEIKDGKLIPRFEADKSNQSLKEAIIRKALNKSDAELAHDKNTAKVEQLETVIASDAPQVVKDAIAPDLQKAKQEASVTEQAVSESHSNEALQKANEVHLTEQIQLLEVSLEDLPDAAKPIIEAKIESLKKELPQPEQIPAEVPTTHAEVSALQKDLSTEIDNKLSAEKDVLKQNLTPEGSDSGIKSKPNGKEEAKGRQENVLNDAGGDKPPVVSPIESGKERLRLAKEKAAKLRDNSKLGTATDPFKKAKEQAEADRDVLDAYVNLAKEYIKEGAKTVADFAKALGEDISDHITKAWEVANGRDTIKDTNVKSVLTRAARGSEFEKEVKQKLEDLGLTYEIAKHEDAAKAADAFIDILGVDEALYRALNTGNKMQGDNRAMVIARAIDTYYNLEKSAKTPEEKAFYQEMQAEALEGLDEMARDQGRFISALHEFYKTSPAAFEKYLKNKENKLSEKELSQKPTGGKSKKEKINKGKKDLTTGAKEKAAKETGQFAKDMQKKSNLSPEKTARKQELKNKFGPRFNESTNLITLVADKEFREYGKLIIEEGAADFKAFAKRATKELGQKVKPILKKWYQAAGGQEDVTGLTKRFEKALAEGNKIEADKAIKKLQNISKDEGLWGQYADEAAKKLKSKAASGLLGDAKTSPPLQSFVDGLVKNLNQKIAESLPEVERAKAAKRPAIEIIGDAIKNKEKYKDVWDKTQAELKEQFKDNPEALNKLDEYFGEIMDKPFSDRLAVEAVNDIVGKHVQSLINMQDKGFDISSYKDEVIEKLIHEAGIKESDAKQLIDAAVEELTKRETIAKDKLQERKNKAEKIKEAAKTKAQELNKKGVNKPLWEPRKQSASESLAKTLEGQILDKSPKQKTAVEEFANRVVSNLSKSAREALATTKKGFDGLSPIQKLAEIVRNKDKYQEVINDAQKQIIDKYKDNPTVLALLDDALFKIGDKPFSEQGLTDALKGAAKKENIDIGKLAEEHFKAEEQASEVLKQKLIDEAGLSDAEATQLSEALQKKFNELVTAKRKQILERMFPKTPLQKLPGLKGKHEKANENIVKAINAGAFDGANFEKLFYEKFGLIDVNKPEVSAKLKDFAEKLHDNKNKSNPLFYDKIMQDMLDYMQNQRKENKLSEGVINQMYAHMLYGQDTHIKNMSYNVQTTIKSIASLSAQNTKYAKEAVKVFINDLYRGKLEAGGIMMEGYNKSGIPSTVPRSINERTGGAWGKYVSVPFRLLSAADASLNFPSRAIKQFAIFVEVAIAKNKELPKDQRQTTSEIIQTVKDQMGYDANAINSAHAEALTQIKKFYGFEDLWIDGKRNPKYADAKYNNVYRDYERSVFNLIESTRDREVTLEAKEWADNTLLMGRPKGYFGVAADAINRLGHSMPVLKVLTTPFVNVPFNIAANLYEYSPAGFINVLSGKEGSVNSSKLLGEYHEISPRRRRDLALKATTGVLGMAAVYQLGNATYYDKKEGKRRPVMVVFGDGTGKFYENKKEESLKGSDKFQEYTIDFMGHRASYKTSPFAAWFVAEGARQDYIRYKATPTEKDNVELLNVVAYSTMKYITFMKDQAAVSGLMDLLNVGEKTQQWNDKTPVSEKISDQLSMQAAKIVRNITVPNFIPNTMREYKGLMEDPETGGRSFIQRLSKDVPFADQFSNQSEDHFGDKITQRFVVPSLWDTRKEDNPLYQMAKDHDYMDKLKFYTDRDIYVNGEYKWLSRDETDKINKLRNKIAGDNIKLRYDALNSLDNEDFKTEMNAIYLDAEKEAKTKMFGSWSNTLRPAKSVQPTRKEYTGQEITKPIYTGKEKPEYK